MGTVLQAYFGIAMGLTKEPVTRGQHVFFFFFHLLGTTCRGEYHFETMAGSQVYLRLLVPPFWDKVLRNINFTFEELR